MKIITENSNATVSYASIAINSLSSSIIAAKNCGYIDINAAIAHVGGVVLSMNNSKITQGANIGNIHVFLRSSSVSYIGGLIAKATSSAAISYSYSVCDISIASAMTITPNAYVGGLVGYMENDNITYSYSNVTKNENILDGNYNAYDAIYQIIGYLPV